MSTLLHAASDIVFCELTLQLYIEYVSYWEAVLPTVSVKDVREPSLTLVTKFTDTNNKVFELWKGTKHSYSFQH